MDLPQDYTAGPMSEAEFTQLQADEQAAAARHGYQVDVQRDDQDGQIFAKVSYAVPATGMPVAGIVAAASGVGAVIAGPPGAALGAAAAVIATGARTPADAAPTKTDIANALSAAATRLNVRKELLGAIAFVESSLNPTAKNPRSSAFGLFQFIDDTWAEMVDRHGATLGVTSGARSDVSAQCLIGAAFLSDNSAVLQHALARVPTDAECYAAHFFGAGRAARLVAGPSDQPADKALGSDAERVISANNSIFMDGERVRTLGEVLAELGRRVTGAAHSAREALGWAA